MSFNDGSSDDSNDRFGAIGVDQQWTQECQLMTDSGSDDDSNDGEPQVENNKEPSYNSDQEDVSSKRRNCYDEEPEDYKPFKFKNRFEGGSQTDSSANDLECYSPSKELRRQSVEFRNSFEEYSPSPKKKRDESYSSVQWNSENHETPFNNSFPDYSSSKPSKHSKEKHSSKKRHEKSEKKSKSHSSKKRKHEEISSSSGSHELFSPERSETMSGYRLPSGNSLSKPIQGGIGASIMGKMGYQSGKGLGKHSQGRVDPVELSKQKGRQGLGLSIPNLDDACDRWDSSLEVIQMKEEVEWLASPDIEPPNSSELKTWMKEGPRNLNISEMSDYCDAHLLASVLSCKSVFDNMEGMDMMKARSRSNPFETIRKGIFQNRAAMKMANIDATFDFMFTNPTDRDGAPMVSDDKLLYFADVCAGPGGFSEYVLWRKKWKAKGIGFTLRGDNDFKLEQFKSGPPETFEPYYGKKDDGNVFDPDNINDLTNLVMKVTKGEGVHFMMADGGFSVEGQENIQELLSKQLYLCQFLIAISIVRTDGHFICKLFDVFSPFSVGLVYLMYRCFHQICIFKPNTSRPANSERYIVCKWKKCDTSDVRDYMFRLNERLCEFNPESPKDVNHCVPPHEMQNDSNFFDYIITSNNKLGERQVVNLAKISAFYRDSTLIESRQFTLRRECLSLWQVPDKMIKSEPLSVEDVIQKLFNNNRGTVFLHRSPSSLNPANLEASFSSSVYDWHYSVLGNNQQELTYFLGLGRDHVARYQCSRGKWDLAWQCTFELSPGTLVLGEIVTEYVGEGKNPRRFTSLHILDAYSLGFEDISTREFKDRLKMCRLYTEALCKRVTPHVSPVRVIEPFSLEDIDRVFESVYKRDLKGGPQYVVEIDDFAFAAKGLLFFSTTKEPWARYKSRGTGYYYYASPRIKESEYEKNRPKDSIATFRDCVSKNIAWWWEEGVGLWNEGKRTDVLHKDDLLSFIHQKTHR